MITAEHKAQKLVISFLYVPDDALPIDSNKPWIDKQTAIRCAMIAAKEVLNEFPSGVSSSIDRIRKEYWKSVLYFIPFV